jgi:hypothetical protein
MHARRILLLIFALAQIISASSSDKELWAGKQHKLHRKKHAHKAASAPVRLLNPLTPSVLFEKGTMAKGEDDRIASVIATAIQSIVENKIVNRTEDSSIISIMEAILDLPSSAAERRASGMLCSVLWDNTKNSTQKTLQCRDAGIDLSSVVFASEECDAVFCSRALA